MNNNAVHVYGQGRFCDERQKFRCGEYVFTGTSYEARDYFRNMFPANSIIIHTHPKGSRCNKHSRYSEYPK